MSERVRSTNTRKTMALVRYTEGGCRWEETTVTEAISEAHKRRGRRLRDARVAALITMKELTDRAAIPQFGMVELSQAQHGTVELSEPEWSALWGALGQTEPID